MVKIGYARVSSKWYRNEVQLGELQRQGCDRVWRDTDADENDGTNSLTAFLEDVSAGDVVVVSRLSAVADSIAELLNLVEMLNKKGVAFRSIAEPWVNTEGERAKVVLDILGGVIDFELGLADLEIAPLKIARGLSGLVRGDLKN